MSGKGCKSSRKHTPITSGAEQGAMGIAYSAKKGETPVSKLRGPAKEMYKSMPKAELKRHLVESKGKNLPKRKTGSQGKLGVEIGNCPGIGKSKMSSLHKGRK